MDTENMPLREETWIPLEGASRGISQPIVKYREYTVWASYLVPQVAALVLQQLVTCSTKQLDVKAAGKKLLCCC